MADAPRERPALLPDLERSRAVLVACDNDAVVVPERQSAARAAQLARALVSPAAGPAFRPGNVTVITSWRRPAEVLDAVRRAAGEAEDVLLFHYVGSGPRHKGFALGGAAPLRAAADLVRRSTAARRVVLLDCEDLDTASGLFTLGTEAGGSGMPGALSLVGKEPTLYFPAGDALVPAGDEFTDTLAEALRSGITDGPELLDLVTLRNAVEGRWAEIGYQVENEYVSAPDRLRLLGGRDVALGRNIAFGPDGDRGRRPFHLDAGVVDLMERWWD